MKVPSPDILDALQQCLRIERTAFEYLHDLEHAMERRGWRLLEKRLDKWVDHARCRRHRLIKRIYEYDEIPNPDSDRYEVQFVPSEMFASIRDFATEAIATYTESTKVLFDAEVFGKPLMTLKRNLSSNQKMLLHCEQILQQIKSLGGDAEYLSEQM